MPKSRTVRPLAVCSILAFCFLAGAISPALAVGARIALTPEMFTSESNQGDPAALIDEQTSEPLAIKPKTCWGFSHKSAVYPMACVLDLKRERDLGTLWLFDKNAAGRFVVQSGRPGAWHDVATDDLRAYDQWKEFRLAERTRYLRFVKCEAGANVAEIALFERSRPDAAITTPTLVDEVRISDANGARQFQEFPAGASQVQDILGRPCRVLPNVGGMKFFAYRLGEGKGLKAGGAYLLELDYPEDAPRSMFVLNRGCEESLGFHTGPTVGDVLKGRYTFSNAESLQLPLSRKHQTWRTLFFLHDRFPGLAQPRGEGAREMLPRDGFWVFIAQPEAANAPLSQGAAVSAIRLFEVPPSFYEVALPALPEGLPRRHIFCREEMGDGAVASADPLRRGLLNITDWYEFKARRMRHLAMDTFTKDLLEFGSTQGWDPSPHGGNAWYYASGQTTLWGNILTMVKDYGLNVLPYYEYAGSRGGRGLGSARPCLTLGGGKVYTHIKWCEGANCDVTDPRFIEDAHNLFDCTLYRFKDRAPLLGAWLRQRPTSMPISFADRCLALFAKEANNNQNVTREQLKADKALYQRYRDWWFEQRHAFLGALRDDLRQGLGDTGAELIFTTDTSEPGLPYPDWKRPLVVADDLKPWAALGIPGISLEQAVREDRHLAALTRDQLTYSWYEWQHAAPHADPEHYAGDDGLTLSYTFNRAYTVGSPHALQAFRTRQGLTLVRHFMLNENEMDAKGADGKTTSPLGYFTADVEAAGPYCMLAEARAMANGDPTQLGYLSGRQYNRGFFEYVRDFNQNFLALPSLPSKVVEGAAPDPEVVVRAIEAGAQGTWLAVVNTGLSEKKAIRIKLPVSGRCSDAVTGKELAVKGQCVEFALRPCQLRALRIQ